MPRVRLIPRPIALALLVGLIWVLGVLMGKMFVLLVEVLYRLAVSAVR